MSIILKGGHASHDMFAIPVPCEKDMLFHIKKKFRQGKTHEGSLTYHLASSSNTIMIWETVDRTLWALLDKENVPFGGIPIAWEGDFQQIFPVVPCGSKKQIIEECLQKSDLWWHSSKKEHACW